jgi:TonB family protein
MRWMVVWGAAALVSSLGPTSAGAASGADWQPEYVKRPKAAELLAVFPKAALDGKITGDVELLCRAAADGALTDCRVDTEKPAGQGFGAAALGLAPLYRIKTKDDDGAPVAGRAVKQDVQFLAPGDTNPEWAGKPSGQAIGLAWPRAAMAKGLGGRARLRCKVTVEGFLDACKVASESPAGYGFGVAALQLAAQFRMKPAIRGGVPMTGEITVPIIWQGGTPASDPPLGTRLRDQNLTEAPSLLLDPPWARAPTKAEMDAVYPATGQDVPSGGQATLRCGFDKAGVAHACDVLTEFPISKGFGQAARALAPRFAVSFSPDQAGDLSKFRVDIPFRFRNPNTPEARKLTKPRWIRTLSAEGMASLYPAAALKAGVTTGLAVINCAVTPKGEMSDCQVTREDPTGQGFGAAGLEAAKIMAMNPWTKEGDPVDGLRVGLPIRFVWEGTTVEPTSAAAAAPTTKP